MRPNLGWQLKILHQKWRPIFSLSVISYCCAFTWHAWKLEEGLKIPPLQKCGILCFISTLLSARSSWKTYDSVCSYRNFTLVSVQWRHLWIAILLKIMAGRYKRLYYKQPLRSDGKLLSIISWSLRFSYLVPSNYHLDDSSCLDLSLINLSFSGLSWTERLRL